MYRKCFFPIFSENVAFFKKLLNEKILKTSFPIKKVMFIFVAGAPFPSKETWTPETVFCRFFRKQFLFLTVK